MCRCHRWAALAAAFLLLVGCKKNTGTAVSADAPAIEAAQKLPEGTNVLAELEQKDYEGAVQTLSKIRSAINNEQEADFAFLKQHVKQKLLDASATDPKAAEALSAVRAMTVSR